VFEDQEKEERRIESIWQWRKNKDCL